MATASPGRKPDYLTCPVCEETYDEKDHLPTGFPCQHCVCIKCLDGIIKRCDGYKVVCPMCRRAVSIPQSKAAGFPNNLAIMDMLAAGQPEGDMAASTCTKHNKVISEFCLTCHEAVCMMCVFKSHKGHDMEELSEVMEKCIGQSAEVINDIVHTCSLVQENITQMAKANNQDCLKILYQLKKCQSDIKNAVSTACATNVSKPLALTAMTLSDEHPVEQFSTQSQVDVLPKADLPESVNNDKLKLLASAKLPKLKHIDMNRRNKLLLVFPQSHHTIYKIHEHKFCKLEQAPLSDIITKVLKAAEHVILSEESKLVMQNDYGVICDNKVYSFGARIMCKVHVFNRDWIALTQREGSHLKCVLIREKNQQDISCRCLSHTETMVVPLDAYDGIGVFNNTGPFIRLTYSAYNGRRGPSFSGNESESLSPMPENVTSAAVLIDLLFLLERGKGIAVYSLQYTENGSRMDDIKLQDLGLSSDCELEKIWAGDTGHGACILHVLYTHKGHGHALASYTMNETFLKKCMGE